jgi:2-octaprenyl-6-methoxyphenol hydroxylase
MDQPFIVIGGSLTGLCVALALSHLGQKTIVVDKKKLDFKASYDGRAIALSYGSKQILEQIGLWQELSEYAGPINEIRVTDEYSPLFLHFNNDETLGYLIESDDILRVIYQKAIKDPNISILDGAVYELQENNYQKAVITLNGKEFSTKLLIAADGKFSHLRKMVGIKDYRYNYQQKAVVCKVQHEKPHKAIAQEIFLPHGPFAILPLKHPNQAGIVWTELPETADSLMKLDDDRFNYFLSEKFTDYLGEVKLVGKKACYPLELILAEKYYHNRVMLIGDAAHAVHPIAGQGFNLALRDIDSVVQLYRKYQNLGLGFACHQAMQEYEKLRMPDNLSMAVITDILNKLFSNNITGIRFIRKLGLNVVNHIPYLQKFFMQYAVAKK